MYAPRTDGWVRALRTGTERVRTRIEANIDEHGLAYPWWIPIVSLVGQTVCVVLSLAVRDALVPPSLIALTLLLVLVPHVIQFALGEMVPSVLETTLVYGAAAWLLFAPSTEHTGTIDPAAFLLTLLTAEVVARDGLRAGFVTGVGSIGLVVAAAIGPGVDSLPIHLLDVALGGAIGAILLWQMRALTAEREARLRESERATLAERQRIAREIHDLVAHSLSVTLLHITGARHALRDVDDDAGVDVSDVDAALADAEQVGRRAMADIRQTVSTLTDGPSATHALPGAADVGGLVAQMELAGLALEYDEDGDPRMLASGTGLGLYRIAQESLANIAKHAPTSTAQVRFSVTPRRARLTVRNARPSGSGVVVDESGSGLAGMRARAEQLGATLVAGPDGTDWVVDLRMPLEQRDGELWCGRKLPRLRR